MTERSMKRDLIVGSATTVAGGVVVAIVVAVFNIVPVSQQGLSDESSASESVQSPLVSEPSIASTSPTAEANTEPVPAPSVAYLAELVPLERDEAVGETILMGGINYGRAIALSSGGCGGNQDTSYSWVVNGQYSTLTAMLGLDDRSLSGPEVLMEVLFDGKPVFSQVVQAGTFVPVALDASGVREIQFHQVYIGPRPNICSSDATAVWGDSLLTR